jgi:hypothetical protein
VDLHVQRVEPREIPLEDEDLLAFQCRLDTCDPENDLFTSILGRLSCET